jgi:hypothetical protein
MEGLDRFLNVRNVQVSVNESEQLLLIYRVQKPSSSVPGK